MKQFGTILKFELKSYLRNKIFIGVTAFLMVLIALIMFLPRILSLMESDTAAKDTDNNLAVMLVKTDDTDTVRADTVKEIFAAYFTDYCIEMTEAELSVLQEDVMSGNAECAFVIDTAASFTYYVNNFSMYDNNPDIAADALKQLHQRKAMMDGGMAAEEIAAAMDVQIEGNVESLGKDQAKTYFYTYIMIVALYMVILLYGQMVATNVATEKSSRAMEVLITSAKPISMMFGKVIASCLAGFIQLVAIFGSAFVLYNANKAYWEDNMVIESIFNIPLEVLVYLLVFFVLGFLIYAFMFGAIGSTASKLEDINTSVMPVTFLFLIAFFVVVFSMNSGNVDHMLMKICSYVPFTSPMAMFTRICMSSVAWYEIASSIGILIVSLVGIGVLSAKIYRVGVLMYGAAPKFRNILKAVWKA